MKLLSTRSQSVILAVVLLAALAFASVSHAQYGGSGGSAPAQSSSQQSTPATKVPAQQATPPQADPEQDKAYKAFTDIKPDAIDQQILAGEQYLQKYPGGIYAEQVYARLVTSYYAKQQFDKMYAAADKATALNPDDVTVLTLVGWVIPHQYDPNDPDSDRRLTKAAGYEKHALEVLPTMPKPAGITDEQFAKAKATATAQAHSGLGLVYFREQDFANAVTEMQKAVAADATPDPVDLYIMGVSLSQLKRYPESMDAFHKCAQMPGAMQDRCKSHEADAKKQAAAAPAPPK